MALLCWFVLAGWHFYIHGRVSFVSLQFSYAVGYGVLALLLLATFARAQLTPYPPLWRLLMLVGAASAAVLELLLQPVLTRDVILSLWAPAVIGASLASMLLRRQSGRLASWIYNKGTQ